MSDEKEKYIKYIRYIKYINFDLDTNQLKDIFPDTRLPYSMIKKFFEDRGFTHRQYSGYISKEPLEEYDITKITKELGKKFKLHTRI